MFNIYKHLYQLHSNPEELYGFDTAPHKVPMVAFTSALLNTKQSPELKQVIMKDPKSAYWYADYILKRRWPEAEPYIMKDPEWATQYALWIRKRRWPEAEPYIMKDPVWAYMYAKYTIKRPWPEAEPYIIKSAGGYWPVYKQIFGL